MPAAWSDLNCLPDRETTPEPKEDAGAGAGAAVEEVQGHVHCIQELLDKMTQGVAEMQGTIRRKDTENVKLCREIAELKLQISMRKGTARPRFGDVSPTPHALNTPARTRVDSPPPMIRVGSPTVDTTEEAPASVLLSKSPSLVGLGWRDDEDMQITASGSSRELSPVPPLLPTPKETQQKPTRTPLAHKHSFLSYRRGKGLSSEEDAMKERVRQAVARPEYNVANFYHDRGIFQLIARSRVFEFSTLAVILVNAIWTAIDCEFNTSSVVSESHVMFQIAENCFCLYFSVELAIRFFAFRQKLHVFKDSWFWFDLLLVVLTVTETWIMPLIVILTDTTNQGLLGNAMLLRLLRLARITRVARLVKLLRCVPELIVVVKAIGTALRSVMYTWFLMVGIIYVFAIAFRHASFATPLGEKYFYGVFPAMLTLLLQGVLPDHSSFVDEVAKEGAGLAVLLMLFIILVSLTVMNMLIGVVVDVVALVSKVENYELHVAFVKHRLLGMMENSGIDEDNNKCISRSEFESILVRPEAARVLQDLGVDPVGLVDFTDFIFKDDQELTFPKFMEVVLQLRGSNTATVRDIVDMRKWAADEFKLLSRHLSSLTGDERTSSHERRPRDPTVLPPAANSAKRVFHKAKTPESELKELHPHSSRMFVEEVH